MVHTHATEPDVESHEPPLKHSSLLQGSITVRNRHENIHNNTEVHITQPCNYHTLFLWNAINVISPLPHDGPVRPTGQIHVNVCVDELLIHVAPTAHGEESQKLIAKQKRKDPILERFSLFLFSRMNTTLILSKTYCRHT